MDKLYLRRKCRPRTHFVHVETPLPSIDAEAGDHVQSVPSLQLNLTSVSRLRSTAKVTDSENGKLIQRAPTDEEWEEQVGKVAETLRMDTVQGYERRIRILEKKNSKRQLFLQGQQSVSGFMIYMNTEIRFWP